MSIDKIKTGQNIRKLRREHGISVIELSKVFGFNNTQSIYKWESGKTVPSIDNLVILARLFNLKVDDILEVE